MTDQTDKAFMAIGMFRGMVPQGPNQMFLRGEGGK